MSVDLIVGLLSTFVPGFVVGYLMLNKNAGVFRMFVAMLLVGLGYLTMTGAIEDIGANILGKSNKIAVPAAAPAAEKAAAPAVKTETAPAAEAAKEETKTAPAAEAPAAETKTTPAPEAPKADAAPAAEPKAAQ